MIAALASVPLFRGLDKMKFFWKITLLVFCIAVAAVAWRVNRTRINQRKLAEYTSRCRAQAEHGDVAAQLKLGSMYYRGEGTPKDYGEAVHWYRKAADQGNAEAKAAVGFAYSHGFGVPQNYAEALRWFRQGAEQGNAKAEYDFGYLYLRGNGVPQDYAEALLWFGKAAEQGDVKAQYAIGFMHEHGQGVPPDSAEAVRWFREAADQGDTKAQYAVGYSYDNGRGVPRNRVEAVRWFRKAVDQGDEHALHALSAQLNASEKLFLVVKFLASLFFLIDFPRWRFITQGKTELNSQRKRWLATGVFGFLTVGLDWYGYATYKIRRVGCGFTGFTLLHWLLSAVWLALLVSIIFDGRRRAMLEDTDAALGNNILETSN